MGSDQATQRGTKDPTHPLDATTQRHWIQETFKKIRHAGTQTSIYAFLVEMPRGRTIGCYQILYALGVEMGS